MKLSEVIRDIENGTQVEINLGFGGKHVGRPDKVWSDSNGTIWVEFNLRGQRITRDSFKLL